MSDFTSEFWNFYVAVISIVGVIACGILLKLNSVRKVDASQLETTGHVWDEDLREYHHPLPRWWIWLFYITIVFSLAYLVLYPGLGRFSGILHWTSEGQHVDELKSAEAEYGPIFARFSGQDIRKLAADPGARSVGQKLFLNYCAQCHASDAAGSKGFPNLADKDWLFGGEPEAVEASILNGRNGVMPAFGASLGEEGARDAAHYVRSLSGLPSDSTRAAKGRERFGEVCAACHGADGKGNQQLGAPDLTDAIWLFGSGENTIVETILKGRNLVMPAHKDFLGETKVHVLAAYVWGLSNKDTVAATPAKAVVK